MSFRVLFTASLLGSLLPLISHAQTAPASARFYVGVGVNMLSDVPFKEQNLVPRLFGPALTAGMQFTSRLAGQIGLSYHWRKYSYSYQAVDQTGYSITTSTYRFNYLIVPAVLRYTVTAPATRFHFDILGGVTLLHTAGNSRTDYFSSTGTNLSPRETSSSYTNVNLTLGPALHYAISSHLELTASSLVSARVDKATYYSFSDRLFLNTAIGANYAFGQR